MLQLFRGLALFDLNLITTLCRKRKADKVNANDLIVKYEGTVSEISILIRILGTVNI